MSAVGLSSAPRDDQSATFWAKTWTDVAPAASAMVGDAILFLLGLLILAASFLGLVGLGALGYPRDFVAILESLHFWGYFAVLGVLLLDLAWKVLTHAFSRR